MRNVDIQCDKKVENNKGELVVCVRSYGHDGPCKAHAADIARLLNDSNSR